MGYIPVVTGKYNSDFHCLSFQTPTDVAEILTINTLALVLGNLFQVALIMKDRMRIAELRGARHPC
jgi:hypothetical protein